MRLYIECTRAEDTATQGYDRSADAEAGIEGDPNRPLRSCMATRRKWITFTIGVVLLMCSGGLWVMKMANDIAYSDVHGLPGSDSDLKTLAFHAEICLALAVVAQIIGISLIARLWTVRLTAGGGRLVLREGFPLALGLVSAVLVFVMLRGWRV